MHGTGVGECGHPGHPGLYCLSLVLNLGGLGTKCKMARERASSGVTSWTENTLFVGPRIPDEVRRMIPHLSSIDKALFRKILQGKLR